MELSGRLGILLWCSVGLGWHDLDNSEYDCWPLDKPNEFNMIQCGGLEMAWVVRPPEVVKSGEVFSVTYSVTAQDSFYQWAVDKKIFSHSSIVDAASARRFCEDLDCPSNWKDADGENCCIHHANIHSCPLGYMSESICGPWIPDDGKIFTHTISTTGKMTQTNWTSKVVLFHPGLTSLIAHIRVGHMQVALESKSSVLPAVICGDGVCEDSERCRTCPADCGECPMSVGTKVSISLLLGTLCTCCALLCTWLWYQKQKLLWDESWIIDFSKIEQEQRGRMTMGSGLSAPLMNSESNSSCMTALSSCTGGKRSTFTRTGVYDGRTVAIKKIHSKTFSLSKTIRREVKQVRELDHPNLCKFIGGCLEAPNVAIVTEYCPKGSLNDVLLNDEIPLNWGFRFSFAMDIARGMSYLHQHRLCHGRLKSLNCVLDDRWVCKITDFGLATFRRDETAEPVSFYQQRLMEVYLPPEFQSSSLEPTQPGDVFCYSIILLEIATRSDPVPAEESNLETSWCLPLPELIRSKTDNCPCPSDYVELIRRCRSNNPGQRPTFEQIKKFVHRINPIKGSPVDMMMNLMEKYSKHLEVLVAERTQDLMHEKQKTDRILYSMLPRQVADDLRQGVTTQAQSYASATVFFSDIVGFTQLSSSSTPYQVVDLLNKLYTTFDEIIDNHDVYKVETIGDAWQEKIWGRMPKDSKSPLRELLTFLENSEQGNDKNSYLSEEAWPTPLLDMVVSGVPKENGILHASEIASMALDLVSVCKSFRIPHKPTMQLQIRAGIHSGPVVAGIVGTKMPRYCLFGDTVNTASRMESTSLALKIQCSSSAFFLLEEVGGYTLHCRGTLQVKGKGDMVTYWLEGKKTNLVKKEETSEAKAIKLVTMDSGVVTTDTEAETYCSLPGMLNQDLVIME